MTFEEIRQAVAGRMAAWNDAPLAWDGQPRSDALQSAIDSKSPWVSLTIGHGNSFTSSIGSSPNVRRPGVIMCQVFTAENTGTRDAMLLADSLAAHLEHYRDGDLVTQAASLVRTGPSSGWYQINVLVPFRAS